MNDFKVLSEAIIDKLKSNISKQLSRLTKENFIDSPGTANAAASGTKRAKNNDLTVKYKEENKTNIEPFVKQFNDFSSYMEKHNLTAMEAGKIYKNELNPAVKEFCMTTDKATLSEEKFRASIQATSLSTNAGQIIKNGLSGAGSEILSSIIEKLISVTASKINDFIHAKEIAIEKAEEISASIDESNEVLLNKSEWISENASNYEKLAQGVDLFGKNISLTKDKFREYQSLTSEIAKMFPDFVRGHDEAGNAILKLGDSSTTTATKLQNLLKAQEDSNNAQIASTLNDEFAGVSASIDKAKQASSDSQKEADNAQNTLNNIETLKNSKLGDSLEIDATDGHLSKSVTTAVKNFCKNLSSDRRIELEMIEFDTMKYDEHKNVIYTPLTALSDIEKTQLKDEITKEIETEKPEAIAEDLLIDAQRVVAEQNSKVDAIWTDALPNVIAAMKSKSGFIKLESEEGLQDIAIQMVGNLPSDISDKIDKNGVYEWVRDNIITKLSNLDDSNKSDFKTAYAKLLRLNPDDFSDTNQAAIDDQIKIISDAFSQNSNDVKLHLGFKEDEDLQASYNTLIEKASRKFSDNNSNVSYKNQRTQLQNFASEFAIDTQNELALFDSCVEKTSTYADAIQTYKKELDAVDTSLLTFDDFSLRMQPVEEGLSQINKIYADVLDGNEFEWSSIINNEEFDKTFHGLGSVYDDFIDTISKNPDNITACQDAFDNLITAYLKNSGALDALSEDKIKQLVDEGNYTDATQQAIYRLYLSKLNVNDTKINTSEDINQLISLANAAGVSYAHIVALQRLLALIGDGSAYKNSHVDADTLRKEQRDTQGYKDSKTNSIKDYVQEQSTQILNDMQDSLNKLNPDDFKTDSNKTSGGAASPEQSKNAAAENARTEATETQNSFYTVVDWMLNSIKKLKLTAERAIQDVSNSLQYALNGSKVKKAFASLNDEMKMNAHMYERYMKSASDVTLDGSYKKKVRNGTMDLEEIHDENLSGKIKEYQDWYDKAKDCKQANEELKKTVQELADAMAKTPMQKAEKKIEKYKYQSELLEAKAGNTVTAHKKNSYINTEKENIDKTLISYKDAVSADTKNMNSYGKAMTSVKQNKENKSLLKEVKDKYRARKPLSDSLLNKIYQYCSKTNNFSWYHNCVAFNKTLEAKTADEETYKLYQQTSKSEKSDLAKQQFDNIEAEYTNKAHSIDQRAESLNNKISITKAKGQRVGADYYTQLIGTEHNNVSSFQNKKAKLMNSLTAAVTNGDIQEYSQQWYEMVASIDDVSNALDKSTESVVEYQNALRALNWDMFDDSLERFSRLISETDYYIDLMSHKKLVDDDTGAFTEFGTATLSLHNKNYEACLTEAKAYAEEYDNIMRQIASGEQSAADENVIKRLLELQDAQRAATLSAEEQKQAMADLVKQGYEAQLSALEKLIKKYKETINQQKDAYDFQKNISEKTQNISELQKMLVAYGDNSTEESKAQIQQLKKDLLEAQEDLKDTQYEKYISDTSEMMDELYTNYEEFLNQKLDDTDALISEVRDSIQNSSTEVINTLNGLNESLNGTGEGMPVSKQLSDILTGINSIPSLLTEIKNSISTSAVNPDTGGGANSSANDAVTAAANAAAEAEKQRKRKVLSETLAMQKESLKSLEKNLEHAYKDYDKAVAAAKKTGYSIGLKDIKKLIKDINDRIAAQKKAIGNTENQLTGFSSGGVVEGINRKVSKNGDDGIASVKAGEAILTPMQTDVLKNFTSSQAFETPDLIMSADAVYFNDLIHQRLRNNLTIPTPGFLIPDARPSDNFGLNIEKIEMNGVQNPMEFTNELKKSLGNRTTQKMIQSFTVDNLAKRNRSLGYTKYLPK